MGLLDGLFGKKKSAEAAAFTMRVHMPDLILEMPRGTTVPGKVLSGVVATGDTVYFTDTAGRSRSCRADVMADDSETTEGVSAAAGKDAVLFLYGVKRSDVKDGMTISGSQA